MRRKDREITKEETIKLLETAEVGSLATVNPDHTPYVVPLNFVYAKEAIYLHSAVEGKKLDNIGINSNVCFSVYDAVELMPEAFSTKYKSAIVVGKIHEVKDPEEKREGLIAIVKKYSPEFYEAGVKYVDNASEKTKVLKIEILQITGKSRG